MRGASLILTTALLSCAGNAFAQDEAAEPTAIVEIGAAGEWGLKGGSAYGPNLSVETTPIESWLEIEAGVSPLFSRGQTEWDSDFLFKKPWVLSDTVEFMFGVGPEWAHTMAGGKSSDTFGGEVALDFMFWPWPERKFGLYLEPAYGYSFAKEHEQSLGMSAGLLIPIP